MKHEMFRRNLKNFNSESFADCVSMKLKIYFDNLEHINKNNINKVCENFVQLIKDEIEKFAPLTNLSRKQTRLIKKPWLIKGIWTSIKNKQRLYEMWFLEGNSYERSFYKKYNNCLTRLKKKQSKFCTTLRHLLVARTNLKKHGI